MSSWLGVDSRVGSASGGATGVLPLPSEPWLSGKGKGCEGRWKRERRRSGERMEGNGRSGRKKRKREKLESPGGISCWKRENLEGYKLKVGDGGESGVRKSWGMPSKWVTLCLYHVTFMIFLMVILLFLIVVLMGGGGESEVDGVGKGYGIVEYWRASEPLPAPEHSSSPSPDFNPFQEYEKNPGGDDRRNKTWSAAAERMKSVVVNDNLGKVVSVSSSSTTNRPSSSDTVSLNTRLLSPRLPPSSSASSLPPDTQFLWTSSLLKEKLLGRYFVGSGSNNSGASPSSLPSLSFDTEGKARRNEGRKSGDGGSASITTSVEESSKRTTKWNKGGESSKEPIRVTNNSESGESFGMGFKGEPLIRFSPSSVMSERGESGSGVVRRDRRVLDSLVADERFNSSSSSTLPSSPQVAQDDGGTAGEKRGDFLLLQNDQGGEASSWQEWIKRSHGLYGVTHGEESSIYHGPSFWKKNSSGMTDGGGGGRSRGTRSACRISEFSCNRGKCVSGDKYCDGVDDCGDGSDEPRLCTPCNRTYYGEWGTTYSLSLSAETIGNLFRNHGGGGKSKSGGSHGAGSDDKRWRGAPYFVCQLAFAAAGENFGDLVQIIFDSVNIGTLSSASYQGCPSGSLEIFEINRPITGGKWCGAGVGYAVYFSEMRAISLTLSLGGRGPTSNHSDGVHSGRSGGGLGSSGRIANESGGNTAGGAVNKWTTKGGDTTVITSSEQDGKDFEFEFKIRYRFIPKSLAVVRYGPLNNAIERGALVPDTYCSRVLDSCGKSRCKIQSPNYPGLYPRNVSCYYTVIQREIPNSKRVLIQVTQRQAHKVQLKSAFNPSISGSGGGGSNNGGNTGPVGAMGMIGSSSAYSIEQSGNPDAILAWGDCSRGERDSLTIYDGDDVNDPVLLKLCGGSSIPPITSSGPAILIAFQSTPYGNPLDPRPSNPFPSTLRGFELDVGVVIVDSESADYSNHHNCNFIFTSSKESVAGLSGLRAQEQGGNWIAGKYGKVFSPRHTLPLNTTCRYEFRGSKDEAVWIYYVAYRRDLIKDSKEHKGNCTTRLRIWDGIDTRNNALLATYCDKELPKLCDHKALENETRLVRACTANESYISAGSTLIIEQQFMEGTALRPLHYQFNYEFVRRHVGTEGSCNRVFNLAENRGKRRGWFRTSENVFDFGRGGKRNVTCTYTFILPPYESLYIRIVNSSFGDRPCKTLTDFETGRYMCNDVGGGGGGGAVRGASASIRILEEVWSSTNVSMHENCICGNSSNNANYFFTFLGRKVHLTFNVERMKSFDSPENFFVHFEWELKGGGCRGDNRYMKTESGTISLESSFTHGLKEKPPSCEHYPWMIEAREGYSLYLRVPGFPMVEPVSSGGGGSGSNNNNPILPGKFFNSTGYGGSGAEGGGISNTIATSFENRLCPTTKNRIFIYDRNNKMVQKICPATNVQQLTKKTGHVVEIYSEDFYEFHSPIHPPPKSQFIIEFIGRELGNYRLQWLEVMSTRRKLALLNKERGLDVKSMGGGVLEDSLNGMEEGHLRNFSGINYNNYNGEGGSSRTPESIDGGGGGEERKEKSIGEQICKSYCPELQACISENLWCDGEAHCPISLADEKSCDSFWLTVNQLMSPAVYIPVAAAIVSALVCCGTVMLCAFLKRTVLNGHSNKDVGDEMSYGTGSRASRSLDRRLERMDPHDPIS